VRNFADANHANHAPVLKAVGGTRISAKAGETLTLEIEASDPDGDELETKFRIYKEVGTYEAEATLNSSGNQVKVVLDSSATGALHVIAEVKDKAVHPMTRYVRFVVVVVK
jgi:hypothetical protein